MKVKSLVWTVSVCLLPLTAALGQEAPTKSKPTAAVAPAPKNVHIEVSENVVKVADWANFKYREVLSAAKAGDQSAIKKFLEFSGTVDGVDALNHAVSCLELIAAASDFPFSMACVSLKPKLKKVLIERLMMAQVRTKKTDLRDSLTHWAPSTWAVLNGGAPICNCENKMDGSPVNETTPTEVNGAQVPANQKVRQ